jgi:hypothetical protein
MSTVETFVVDDMAYEIESIETNDRCKGACACPKCEWSCASDGFKSPREAIDAVIAHVKRHHAISHEHAPVRVTNEPRLAGFFRAPTIFLTECNSNMDDTEVKHDLLLKALVRESAEVQQRLVGLILEKERLERRAAELGQLIRRASEY